MKTVIYHNPACGTSRQVLALIRERSGEPQIVEYLKQPFGRAQLATLLKEMEMTPREFLRKRGTPYHELNLDDIRWTDEDLIGFMCAYPILVERPIVVAAKGTRLCRPAETVLDML